MSLSSCLLARSVRCARLSSATLTPLLVSSHQKNPGRLVQAFTRGRQNEDKMTEGPVHVVDAVLQDHKEIKAYYNDRSTVEQECNYGGVSENRVLQTVVYFKQFKAWVGNPLDQAKWSNQYIWKLAQHAIAEELVVYPALEKYVPTGKAMADDDRRHHQRLKESLATLEKADPKEWVAFDKVMDHTHSVLMEHMTEEEARDLKAMRGHIPEEEARKLAKQFELTKKFAPTHPHPSVPNKPPFETVVALLAAPIDRLRDMLKTFPSEEELKAVQPN